MKPARKGFTLIEAMLAAAVLGLAGLALGLTFATVSTARIRTDLNREVRLWHHGYAMGMAKGELDRGSGSGSGNSTQSFTLQSGILVSVTDSFLTSEPTAPNLLFVVSVATWTVPGGAGGGVSTITVARPTVPTVL
jgi:prepilin-type N-terminal cleavage/methylation domain-containing protein